MGHDAAVVKDQLDTAATQLAASMAVQGFLSPEPGSAELRKMTALFKLQGVSHSLSLQERIEAVIEHAKKETTQDGTKSPGKSRRSNAPAREDTLLAGQHLQVR